MVQPLIDMAMQRFPATEGFRITQTLIDELQRELQGNRPNPVKIAARYGVPAGLVRFIMQESPSPNTEFVKHSTDGWGKKELRPWLVSRKASGDAWPEADKEKIEKAREAYDDGITEMCQGRDGDFILLYSIPRKRPVKRIYRYFSETVIEDFDDEG